MKAKIGYLIRELCELDTIWEFYTEEAYKYDYKYSYEVKRIVYFELEDE
jgi:hypothetical protein